MDTSELKTDDYPRIVYMDFKDVAPRIGSGRRRVQIMSIGPVWATIRYKKAGWCWITHKFKRPVWDSLWDAYQEKN